MNRHPAWYPWIAVGMLLVLFASTTPGARRASLIYDEPIYIAAGYSDLATGDLHWHHC